MPSGLLGPTHHSRIRMAKRTIAALARHRLTSRRAPSTPNTTESRTTVPAHQYHFAIMSRTAFDKDCMRACIVTCSTPDTFTSGDPSCAFYRPLRCSSTQGSRVPTRSAHVAPHRRRCDYSLLYHVSRVALRVSATDSASVAFASGPSNRAEPLGLRERLIDDTCCGRCGHTIPE